VEKYQFLAAIEKPDGQYMTVALAATAPSDADAETGLKDKLLEAYGGKLICAYRVTGRERNHDEFMELCDRFGNGEDESTLPIELFFHDPYLYAKLLNRSRNAPRKHMR
jgi:hypothetical protein